jgi:hypothetical protein
MGSSAPTPVNPDEVGTESRDAQSAWIGGGRMQPYLSASKFADANEGSRDKRRPLLWAAGFVGVLAVATALLILFVR